MSMSDVDLDDSLLAKNLSKQSSTSTIGSVSSSSSATQKPSRKEKIAAKKRSIKEKKKEKEKIKKLQTNKISKDDFYRKHTEFRTWLFEEKKLKFEELSLTKAKDHFKKFTKKWNSDKLPKCYYRGIDVCWQEGSPATQVVWAQPKPLPATPGSLREEALEEKYSRKSSVGTFGKKAGRKAMKELQMARNELEGSPELADKKSNPTAPQTATIKRHGKLRPVSMMFAPPPPPLRLNSQLSASQPSFPAIYGQSPSLKMSTLDISEQPEPESENVLPTSVPELESSPRSLRNRKRPSSGSLNENEQKMVKQDSYTQRLQSASEAMFSKPNTSPPGRRPATRSQGPAIMGDNREPHKVGDNWKFDHNTPNDGTNRHHGFESDSRKLKQQMAGAQDDESPPQNGGIPDYENNVLNTFGGMMNSKDNLQIMTVTQAKSLDDYVSVSSKYGKKSRSTAI